MQTVSKQLYSIEQGNSVPFSDETSSLIHGCNKVRLCRGLFDNTHCFNACITGNHDVNVYNTLIIVYVFYIALHEHAVYIQVQLDIIHIQLYTAMR